MIFKVEKQNKTQHINKTIYIYIVVCFVLTLPTQQQLGCVIWWLSEENNIYTEVPG